MEKLSKQAGNALIRVAEYGGYDIQLGYAFELLELGLIEYVSDDGYLFKLTDKARELLKQSRESHNQ